MGALALPEDKTSNMILIEIAELEFVRSGKLEDVRTVLLENVLEKLWCWKMSEFFS